MGQNQFALFKDTINHKSHKEFLFYASFTKFLEKKLRENLGIGEDVSLGSYFGMYRPVRIGITEHIPDRLPSEVPELMEYYKGIDIPEGSFIDKNCVLHIPGSMYHFTHMVGPLRNAQSLKDLEKFPFQELLDFDEDEIDVSVQNAHKEKKVAYCSIGHMYENAWQIRGYEEFLIDMMTQPEMSEYILDRICDKNVKVATAAAKAGVDMITTADDVANQNTLMFSLDMWRRFIKKRWERVYKAARSIKPDIQIKYHSDGNIKEIIPELIEIGVTILNPIQPECLDVVEVKKKYGEQIVLDGTIGTQTTFPFGTPEEVRKVVRQRKELLGRDGALILAPTHVLEPEVPVDNVLAFIDECKNIS